VHGDAFEGSDHLSPAIADKVEQSLPVEEFDRRLRAFTDEEREEALALIRWFKRRYPTAKERLDFARRMYEQWTRPTQILPREGPADAPASPARRSSP
jgi:hypothetical protein